MELYIQKTKIFDDGTNSSTVNNYITDATKSWTTNEYKDYYVFILSGTGSGLIAKITSNTATTLNFAALTISLDTTSFYQIVDFPYERVEMFQDEKVSVTSSIQNYSDIGKLFTDYSQSFTIPASSTNNAIFSHWYESEVDDGYDARIRYNAYIEIDTVKFKDGNVQLEKANKKNGYVESYTLTFYGNLTQLRDNFGDDKLNSLDYIDLNHNYNSTEVISRITTTGLANGVKYPLIGNSNKYSYQDGTATDVTTSLGAIKWNDLFPAITLQNIFSRIQSKYGITFTGSFFNLDQWTKLYLYLKQGLTMSFISEPQQLIFPTVVSTPPYVAFPELNLTTGTLTTNWDFSSSSFAAFFININITPSISSSTIPYVLYVYKDGVLFSSYTLTGTQTISVDNVQRRNDLTLTHIYTFKLSVIAGPFTYTSYIEYFRNISFGSTSSTINSKSTKSLTSANSIINISNYIPDIKIVDFITGLIKAFNLIVIPKPNNTYEFIPLEMFYNAGKITDITEYVYSDELSIDKTKLFKTMNFTYEESNNILNNAYKGLYQQSYGDLIYKSKSVNETSTYEIKLPFENVLFEVPTQGKLFQTATLVNKDNNPYTPKPMLIYCNGLVGTLTGTDQIYVSNSLGAATTINNYQRFSNEYDSLPTDATHSHLMTMNFGNEQSSWLNVLAPQGLYFRHYKNYVDNLYDVKTRILKVKALLPTSLLASNVIDSSNNTLGIALNDRLIIRDKRYIINSYTTDLTTKEAEFELITDYRGVDAANSVGFRFASFENFQTDKEQLILDIELYLNDNESFDIKASTDFLSYTHTSNNKTDATLKVTIPANATAVDRLGVITLEYYRNGVKQNDQFINITQTAI
jgi:hypothetical protein